MAGKLLSSRENYIPRNFKCCINYGSIRCCSSAKLWQYRILVAGGSHVIQVNTRLTSFSEARADTLAKGYLLCLQHCVIPHTA